MRSPRCPGGPRRAFLIQIKAPPGRGHRYWRRPRCTRSISRKDGAMRTLDTSSPAWFESWFDTPDYHRLYANHDRGEATAFVDRLVARPPPAPQPPSPGPGRGAGPPALPPAAHAGAV